MNNPMPTKLHRTQTALATQQSVFLLNQVFEKVFNNERFSYHLPKTFPSVFLINPLWRIDGTGFSQ
jgi:hypothetical protein